LHCRRTPSSSPFKRRPHARRWHALCRCFISGLHPSTLLPPRRLPPLNASAVDFAASVGNVCLTGRLGWLGCPAGKALVVPASTVVQPFRCLCGSGFDISTRAVEGVVDHLLAPYFADVGVTPPLCAELDYPVACGVLMGAAGCAPADPVGGCSGGRQWRQRRVF
jgi:hypothetical protein